MKFSEIRNALSGFHQVIRPLMKVDDADWLPTVDAKWLDERDPIFKNRFGVYFYSSEAGDVLYIGKGQDSTLLQRVWRHLARPSLERKNSADRAGLTIYPEHQWNGPGGEYEAAASIIARGEFGIDALALLPSHVAGLYESFALTVCQLSENCLPTLNRKLG